VSSGAMTTSEASAAALEGLLERTSLILDERVEREVARRRLILHDRGWLIRRALVAADILGLISAFAVAAFVSAPGYLATSEFKHDLMIFLAALPLWVVLGKAYGLYDRDGRHAHYSSTADVGPVFHALTLSTFAYALGCHALGFGIPGVTRMAAFWLASVPLVALARAGARSAARGRAEYLQNTVIVGAGDVGQTVARKFLHHPEYGINVVGFVDSAPKERGDDLEHLVLLGPPSELPEFIRLLDVERVVFAFSNESHEDVLALIRELRDLNVQIDIVPRLFDLIGPGVEMHTVEGMPLVGLSTLHLSRSSKLLKRSLDTTLALLGLALLAPLFALVAIAIKLTSEGPVFFRQRRVGEGGDPFDVFKFRTMTRDAEERKHELAHLNRHLAAGGDPRMFKIVNDPRVTRVGRVLRKYFIDELPQLINVVRGEMSLIGPRPLILDEARYVDDWGRRRLDLKPGMTGVWQVLGRSAISFEEMVKLDYLYVTTWSLGNDVRLLLQTVPLVLRGEAPV
jgi:exopolysaccharide biosynthesis polyprenyl glycosylphosphotransferase